MSIIRKFRRAKYIMKDFWYSQVQCRFKNRQQYLLDVVPRTFRDIDSLIEDVTFACLINYWEKDGGAESLKFQYTMFDDPEENTFIEDGWTPERIESVKAENLLIYTSMREAYEWAKRRKADKEALDQMLTTAYKTPSWKAICGEYHEAEAKAIATDTKYLTLIVQYRQTLWT